GAGDSTLSAMGSSAERSSTPSSSSLPATARTPAAVTSTAAPTTVAPTLTVVATTVTAASATAITEQPDMHADRNKIKAAQRMRSPNTREKLRDAIVAPIRPAWSRLIEQGQAVRH